MASVRTLNTYGNRARENANRITQRLVYRIDGYLGNYVRSESDRFNVMRAVFSALVGVYFHYQ